MTLHPRGVIVIRGYPNSETGALSSIAKERFALALTEYARHPGWKFLLTGGYGAHFNITDQSHAAYLKRRLVSRGVSDQEILEFVESANTARRVVFNTNDIVASVRIYPRF